MKKKKKILHIVESFGGGTFSFLVDLANFTSAEYEVVIAFGKRKETFENYKSYFNDNIRFIEVKNFSRSLNPIKSLKAFIEIKKIIKNENPDIIHLHSSIAGFLGRLAADCDKYKVIYTPHGFSFLMKSQSIIKRRMYFWLEKFAAKKNCKVIGCSNGEYEEALKLTKNSVCIINGIDTNKLPKRQEKDIKQMAGRKLKIVTIGRIGAQKNPTLFNEIANKFPNYKFIWIGDGKDKNILSSPNIEVTGWKSKEEVYSILSKTDVFLLPSLWEGLPISLLEAMYMKNICIVSNCIGNRDVIKNKWNGFICASFDEYINTLKNLKNYNLDEIRENAYNDVQKFYNTQRMVEEYKLLYKQK
jgi:hypothetical protein